MHRKKNVLMNRFPCRQRRNLKYKLVSCYFNFSISIDVRFEPYWTLGARFISSYVFFWGFSSKNKTTQLLFLFLDNKKIIGNLIFKKTVKNLWRKCWFNTFEVSWQFNCEMLDWTKTAHNKAPWLQLCN